jgi:hypothetical protein
LEAKGYLHIRTVSSSLTLRRTNSSPESLTPDEQLFVAKLCARHAEVVVQNRSNLSLRKADAALRQWLKEAEREPVIQEQRRLLPGIIFSILLCFGINGPGRPEFGTTGALLGLLFTGWSVAVCVTFFIAAQL